VGIEILNVPHKDSAVLNIEEHLVLPVEARTKAAHELAHVFDVGRVDVCVLSTKPNLTKGGAHAA
jgi:hypothetical protein